MSSGKSTRDIVIGQPFGRWRTVERIEPAAKGERLQFLCECSVDLGGCGTRRVIKAYTLMGGSSRSCGCLKLEISTRRLTTHGMRGHSSTAPEYWVWASMHSRCYNEAEEKYPRYGGRGITICDRWRHDFAAFLADMGPRPSKAHSIDRIDNDGNYEPGNCRWATAKEQSRNQSKNRLLTHDGKTMIATDWAISLGWEPSFLFGRLDRGWTVEQALTTPPLGFGYPNSLERAVIDGRAVPPSGDSIRGPRSGQRRRRKSLPEAA